MAKIPFDIKYRPEIEAGKYKVVTRDGRDVRILCWDANQFYPICAQFRLCAGTLIARYFDCNGIFEGSDETENGYDLFLVTPEPEMSEWQTLISGCLQKYGLLDGVADRIAKESAAELLALAEREIVNRVAKECYKENFCIEDTVKFNEGYKLGKEVALKDLPRWKKATGKERFNERMVVLAGDNDLYCTNYAEEGEYYLPFPILEKLPKEDESHE